MTHKLTTEEMGRMSVEEFRQSEKLPLTVVLDNVRSLNNIGSVFRTSDAFRVEHIALCGITATPPHREIHKTALGAEESVEWSYHEDTVECVKGLKERGYKVYAVEIAHDSIKLGSSGTQAASLRGNDHGLRGNDRGQDDCLRGNDRGQDDGLRGNDRGQAARVPVAVVFGNEIDGVQEAVMELCDGALEIPQEGTKHSLNVSCAAAIVIWEMYKELRVRS